MNEKPTIKQSSSTSRNVPFETRNRVDNLGQQKTITQDQQQHVTCLSSDIDRRFMSCGYWTESKIGLDAGPEYGGPEIVCPFLVVASSASNDVVVVVVVVEVVCL